MKELIIKVLGEKPLIGMFTSFGGLGAAVLAYMKVITIVAGCFSAVFGAIIGGVTIWGMLKKSLKHKR